MLFIPMQNLQRSCHVWTTTGRLFEMSLLPALLPLDRDTHLARHLEARVCSGCMLPVICNRQETALQVMYNRAAQFWHALYNIFSQYKLIKGRKWMHFFGTQQRFFRQMLMAAKVRFTRTSCHCGWFVVLLTNISACLLSRSCKNGNNLGLLKAGKFWHAPFLEAHTRSPEGKTAETHLTRQRSIAYIISGPSYLTPSFVPV